MSEQFAEKYKDPENVDDILVSIREAKTLGDVYAICDQAGISDWVVKIIPEYSTDYTCLKDNHREICNLIGTTPKAIMLVAYLSSDNEKYKLIKFLSELMTKSGFSVRRYYEFVPCSVCGLAIPTLPVYELLKNSRISNRIPPVHSYKCTTH